MGIKYRADIDGLRSFAILPVVFYHMGVRHLTGGFVGVDVFFVISGYLITGILVKEIEARTYSLQSFYARRARRLLPALFTVLATAYAAGYFLLLPGEFSQLCDSIVSTVLFCSNFYFLNNSNYFSPLAEHMPLLHTWSLAVEEQYYLIFPLLLAFCMRFGRTIATSLVALLCVASLAYCIYLLGKDETAAFYLPFTRFWELLIGSLLALGVAPNLRGRLAREAAAAAGVLLICASAVLFHGDVHGLPAGLFACLGAALVLTAGAGPSWISERVIASRPLVYVGKISYSLYLWHWPIIVLYKLTVREQFHVADQVLVFSASFFAAMVSTHLIEAPFRGAPTRSRSADPIGSAALVRAPPWPVLVTSLTIGCLFVAVAAATSWSGGVSSRFPPQVMALEAHLKYGDVAFFRTDRCFLSTRSNDFSFYDRKTCLAADSSHQNFLLLGDSHAAHLWRGLSTTYTNIKFEQATVAGCKPFIHPEGAKQFLGTCRSLMSFMFQDQVPHHHYDGIILSARWDAEDPVRLAETIRYLRRYSPHVYVLGPIVEYSQPLPRLLAYSILEKRPDLASTMRLPRPDALDESLNRTTAAAGGDYVSLLNLICSRDRCITQTDAGVPILFDENHFTQEGSLLLARRLRSAGLFTPKNASAPT